MSELTSLENSSLVDIGANLTNSSFASDLEQVVEQSIEAGVAKMLVTGTDLAHSQQAVALSQEFPGVLYATAGVHPHDASSFDEVVASQLQQLYQESVVVAVGECGLDYNRNYSSKKEQLKAFEAQLELAQECQLPLFLHQRDAHQDFYKLLEKYRDSVAGGVAHCFTAGAYEMDAYLEMELYIGMTGWICDERRGQDVKALVSRIPLERILIETDAPYLLPRDLSPKPKSRRNEPRYLVHIAQVVAAEYGLPLDELAKYTWENSHSLFTRLAD